MPSRFNIILTAASDISRILPMAMLEYRSVRAASISQVGLKGFSSSILPGFLVGGILT